MGLFDSLTGAAGSALGGVRSGVRAIGDPLTSLGLADSVEESSQKKLRQRLSEWESTPISQRPYLKDKWKAEDSQFRDLFASLIPEPALRQVGKIPLIGEEAERTIGGVTSPLALALIIGTGGVAGPGVAAATTAYGTAGAFGLGLAGQAAEEAGINPRLKIPLGPLGKTNIGPRAAGEIAGGFWMGPKRLLPRVTAEDVDLITQQVDSLRAAGYEVPPELEKTLYRTKAQVDDSVLERFDYTEQIKQGGCNSPCKIDPPMLETSYGDWLKEMETLPLGQGALGGLPELLRKPIKFVTDRATMGLALKAGSPDFFAMNYLSQAERIVDKSGGLVRGLAQMEKNAGLLARERNLTEKAGEFILGTKVATAQERIAGMADGRGGLEPTIENIFAKPKAFKLSPQASDTISEYNRMRQDIYDEVVAGLKAAGIPKAQVEQMIRQANLEPGAIYFHRVALDESDNLFFAQKRSQVGSKQGVQHERVPDQYAENLRSAGSLAVSMRDYAIQMTKLYVDNTVWLPMLKKMGVSTEESIPLDFKVRVAQLKAERDWLNKALVLTRDAKFGRPTKDVARRVRELSAEDVPDELKDIFGRLSGVVDEQGAMVGSPLDPKQAARQVEKELKAALGENFYARGQARNVAQLAKRQITRGYTTLLDMQKFPGLSQWKFEENWAKQINQAFDRMQTHSTGFWQQMGDLQTLQQGLQAGTSDMGMAGLQLMSMFNPLTAHMLPVVIWNSLRSGATERFLLGAVDRFPAHDTRSMQELATLYGPRMVVEVAQPAEMLARPGGITGKAGKALSNLISNKAFSRSIAQGRQVLFENGVKLTEAFKRGQLTPEDYRAVGRLAGTLTGDFDWTRAGISQTQRGLERGVGRFAPGWLRSQMQLVMTAATPFAHGTEQNLARAALGTQILTISTVYTSMAYLLGQKPHLDPTDPGKFMTLEVGGQRVGPGGPILSLMKTAGLMSSLAYTAATADTPEARKAALDKLTHIKDTGNPLTKFWRGGAPTLTGLMYDIVRGRESYGDNQLGDEHLKETGTAFLKSFEPFGVQALREEGPVSAGFQFFGGRAFPMSAPEKFLETADQKAQEAGFKSWASAPQAAQADLLRNDKDLQDAQAAQDKYFERFGSDKDAAFKEVDKSRQAVEDALLGSYDAVLSGGLDVSLFRQRFSELQQQHAYLSNSLLDSQTSGDKPMPDETKQDYYARIYAAIQPETFDENQDGVIEEAEWQQWRKARNEFWSENPESGNYRTYIIQEYPTRQWNSPEMAGIARERYHALDLYDQFLQIPKYRGLTSDDALFIDSMRQIKSRVTSELKYRAGASGAQAPEIGSRQGWGLALKALQQSGTKLTGRQKELLNYAIALDKPKVKAALLNPERSRFLSAKVSLVDWYPSAVRDAGLDTAEAGALGLEQGGTSSQELLGNLAA